MSLWGALKKIGGVARWNPVTAPIALGYEQYKSLKKKGDRQKSYINDAYQTASQRMQSQQAEGTENNLESLNARGMLGGGASSPIAAAMANGRTPGATDLAGASRSRLAGEYQLDRKSLDSARDQALNQNKADTLNSYLGAVTQRVGLAATVAGMPGAGAALDAAAPAPSRPTPIASAMLSGSAWDGVNPVDPLGDPTSSWHVPKGLTIDGSELRNSQLNTSGVVG